MGLFTSVLCVKFPFAATATIDRIILIVESKHHIPVETDIQIAVPGELACEVIGDDTNFKTTVPDLSFIDQC